MNLNRIRKMLISIFSCLIMSFMFFGLDAAAESGKIPAYKKAAAEKESMIESDKETKVQLLFTHDMHSHLDAYKTERNGQTVKIGGLAKLKTVADRIRNDYPVSFLVDGGDFSMGTLYQTIYETDAAELMTMGFIGYDAATFGNHEFDYRSQGISNMLQSAVRNAEERGIKLPALVNCNIDWSRNTSEENMLVKEAMEYYGCAPYKIIERNGIKLGVFGVLGRDAEACAPESGIHFDDIIESSALAVEKLKTEGADLILCLSHSGTFEDKDKSEDEILAKKVPDIDIIISGHTHTRLDEYINYGDTYIVSAGSYCESLGELVLSRKDNGRWQIDKYILRALDENIEPDTEITAMFEEYKEKINKSYLSRFNYTFDQVLAENSIKFSQMDKFAEEHKEDPLGSIIADSYIYAVQQAEGDKYEKVYVTVSPSGTIRDTLQKGEITVADAFNVSSLGIGADRIPGYPLVSVYLTGKELKTAAEIDVSVSPIMTTAQLYPSGIRWSYNPNRIILNRVTDVEFVTNVPYTGSSETEQIEDEKLYRVVAGLYSAQMLGAVEDSSMGLLNITPKDKEGRPITDFEKHIIHNKEGEELKEWYALACYLESFKPNDKGVPEIPVYYEEPEGRKQEINSRNPIEIFKQPNKFAFMIYGVVSAVILFIAGIITAVYKIVKRNKNKK